MDEEQLKQLLGENFDGAKDFFKGQILNTGDYVSAGKAKAEKDDLQKKLNEANQKIKEKMSDDELKQEEVAAKDKLIEQLKQQLTQNAIEANQSKAISGVAEATTLMGIKSDDKDFTSFIANIASEDSEKTTSISQYVNRMIKEAYEKGKSEATKQNLSKIGGFNANGSSKGSENPETESLATRLAKQNSNKRTESSYFKN